VLGAAAGSVVLWMTRGWIFDLVMVSSIVLCGVFRPVAVWDAPSNSISGSI
jgi:hypothetical protein